MPAARAPHASSTLWFAYLACLAIACGDDDSPPSDAGVQDASRMIHDAAPIGRVPHLDAQVPPNDPIPRCDRADPSSCGPGKVCDLLIRRSHGQQQAVAYTGCVDARPERALGDPCDPTFSGPAYMAKGLLDEVHTDPCGPGLICGPDPKVRRATSCQPLCQTSRTGLGSTIRCANEGALCLQGSDIVEYCSDSDRCDVTTQKGCSSGANCYLWLSDDAHGLVGLCGPQSRMPVADGEMCNGPYDCNPGSICLGPLRLPIERWQNSDLRCRRICDGAEDDAGVDDAGVGSCKKGTRCVPFSESGFKLNNLPKAPHGQCE